MEGTRLVPGRRGGRLFRGTGVERHGAMECHDGGSGVSGPGKRKKVAGATNPFGGMGHILSEWLGKDGRPRTERWGNRVRVLRRGIEPG